jgi:hypothetical protein
VPFAAGEDATVLAHLNESGAPTAAKFVNDLSRAGFLKSRVTVHHAAAAPAVDITLERPWKFFNKSLTIENAANGAQASAEVFLGRWNVDIAPAGSDAPVFETSLIVKPFKTYLVYAVGSLSSGSFALLVEPVNSAWWWN